METPRHDQPAPSDVNQTISDPSESYKSVPTKRVSCVYCSRNFSSRGNLNRHTRQTHSDQLEYEEAPATLAPIMIGTDPIPDCSAKVSLERLDLTRTRIKPEDPIKERRLTLLQDVSDKTTYKLSNSQSVLQPPPEKITYPCKFGVCTNKSYGAKSHLYEHYSLVHRRAQLANHVKKGKLCGIVSPDGSLCRTRYQDLSQMIRHIGTVHRLVEKYLPRSLRLDFWTKGSRQQKKKKPKRLEQSEEKENHGIPEETVVRTNYANSQDADFSARIEPGEFFELGEEKSLILNEQIIEYRSPLADIRDVFDEEL